MNLYVWRDVLGVRPNGIIFAMAENVKQAREVVLKQGHAHQGGGRI